MAIALQIKFPVPDRTNQKITRLKGEDGIVDIGWSEGLMSDGRPFRIEMWAQDQVSMLTVFFSARDLSELGDEHMERLIVSEAFVTFREGASQYIKKQLIEDAVGNTMWSVNIVVGDEDETYVANSLPIFAHPTGTDKHTSIFNRPLLANGIATA